MASLVLMHRLSLPETLSMSPWSGLWAEGAGALGLLRQDFGGFILPCAVWTRAQEVTRSPLPQPSPDSVG